MVKKINKKNIKKYAAVSLLVAALTPGVGLAIQDARIDHTEEICHITKIFTASENLNFRLFAFGAGHQINQMEDEYNKRGFDTKVIYNSMHKDEIDTTTKTLAMQDVNEDETVESRVPIGDEETLLDDAHYAVKTMVGESSFCEAFEVYFSDNAIEPKILKLR